MEKMPHNFNLDTHCFLQQYTGQEEEDEIETEEDTHILNPTKYLFSQALRECQNRRFRSEVIQAVKKPDRRRPASLDLSNQGSNFIGSSLRFGGMKKSYVSSRKSGTFPSPERPNYQHGSVGIQKGGSSERVPLPANGSWRHVSASLFPFNKERTLPSKWEDAEKWIFSPVSRDGVSTTSFPPLQRRLKSKSGPLGPPGNPCYSTYSHAMPMFESGSVGNFMADSLSTGVTVAHNVSLGSGRGDRGSYSVHTEPSLARSASVHGWSDPLGHSLLPRSQDEKLDGTKDAETMVSHVSRRNMATQMSPEGSTDTSRKGRPSFSPSPPSLLPIVELQSGYHAYLEVKDVPVDKRVTATRWSKKKRARVPEKGLVNIEDWKKKAAEARDSAWEVAETAKCISKFNREEANISAWENLQKAKSEAAIRKLEMKLEKKRSSSMDKIMNKLRSAQRKAQEMRSSVPSSQAHQVARTSYKVVSFRKTGQIGSLSGCFTCHAF